MDRERCRQEAELQRLRSVADETRKWEEREAWLVQRISDLEDRSPLCGLGGSCGGAGGMQEAVGPGVVGGNTRGKGEVRFAESRGGEESCYNNGEWAAEFTLPGGLASHTEPGTPTPLTTGESVPQLITSASVSTLPIAPMNACWHSSCLCYQTS